MRRVCCCCLLTLACAPPATIRVPTLGNGSCGMYDARTRTVYLADDGLAHLEATYPGRGKAWCEAHEEGHRWFVGRGIDLGPGLLGQERGAQCKAELDEGLPSPYVNDEQGYWDCPDWALEVVARAAA